MVRPALLADLRGIVGADGVIDRPEALLVYECDGYTLERAAPEVVVLPRTPAEVAAVLRLLAEERVAFVPRGAGTGLSGGTLPLEAPVVVGAEGTFGIVTRATLRLVRAPEAYRTLLAVFESVDAASEAVSGIIAAGIVPAALEMMDRLILQALEQAYHIGLPTDAGAVLLIELDGPAVGLDPQAERVAAVCRQNRVREVRVARDEAERAALWKCRKRAFGAVGRLAPNYCTQDGVVPRTRVPDILRHIAAAAERHRLRIANVFHAGDGNIHPILLFDERDRDEVRRVLAAGREILEACIALGGSLTGEHGIGVEKMAQMPLLFGPDDLAAMVRLRAVFDPEGRANPHKIFPDAKVCVETRAPRRQAAM